MIYFLCSSPGGSVMVDGRRQPAPLNPDNGFVETLKRYWKPDARILIVSSDPDALGMNDGMKVLFAQAFPMSGCSVERVAIWDRRNEKQMRALSDYDVVILAGGHVPTQNAFFQAIHLKERLECFEGILIGVSAGTMNSAALVYAQPELEGEGISRDYQRFLPGLGITQTMVLPHYQETKDTVLDGLRLFEDITYPDSMGRQFYALVDGSYLFGHDGQEELRGEAYLIQDGVMKQVSGKGEILSF